MLNLKICSYKIINEYENNNSKSIEVITGQSTNTADYSEVNFSQKKDEKLKSKSELKISKANEICDQENAKPINLMLKLEEVEQGNGNGKKITYSETPSSVFRTTDLVACIAVLISNKKECVMIHSDANGTEGKGKCSLKEGLLNLGLSPEEKYSLSLIGGDDDNALNKKEEIIKGILPDTHTNDKIIMKDSAYITNNGVVACTKNELQAKLGAASISYESPSSIQNVSKYS